MSETEGANSNELLLAACREDNLELLEEVLSSDSSTFDINHRDGAGNSALHYAARSASKHCLEVILHYEGIKVNIANRLEGDTPLHKAAAYEDPKVALEMCQHLIDHGALLTALNKNKQTPADVATNAEVKACLEEAALATQFDARDIPPEDSDSDGTASDEE